VIGRGDKHVFYTMTTWLLLQLVDGAFPSGGFAHSAGLEPSLHLRGIGDLEPFVDEALWQTGRTALPFVRRACEAPAELAALDALYDATQTSHVANRACRAQGRSLAGAACRVF
jgi:urease accessory protein